MINAKRKNEPEGQMWGRRGKGGGARVGTSTVIQYSGIRESET